MGIRIHKCMGWGLTPAQLKEHAAFASKDADESEVAEELWDHLRSIKTLIPPITNHKLEYAGKEDFIFVKNLLNKNFKLEDKSEDLFDTAEDLYQSVYTFDTQLGIEDEGTKLHLFVPNGYYAKKWFRYNDDLDYNESCLDDASTPPDPFGQGPGSDLVAEMRHNPYPYTNNLMDAEGNSVLWTAFGRNLRPKLLPEPPLELIWWLTESGVLKPGAWIHLRPYFARYWS